MSSPLEPNAPLIPPSPLARQSVVPIPIPEANASPFPAPTPFRDPTPGPLPLVGRGHPVSSVEIIGQPVGDSGPLNALHLSEVIHYADGTKPDIVGFDPEGHGFFHGGDRLFAETSIGHVTPEQYIAAGRSRYSLTIEPSQHQSLDQFVAAQERAWIGYDRSSGVPRYDFVGNDPTLHNSNGALIASIHYAGRPDIAARLQRDMEPPDRMRALETGPDHLSPEAAAMRVALERRLAGLPYAPGASHELTRLQTRGTATPEPEIVVPGLTGREIVSARDAIYSMASDAIREEIKYQREPRDLLAHEGPRAPGTLPVMRVTREGAQSIQQMCEPFNQSGRILAADQYRVVQQIRGGETMTYRTDDLLAGSNDRSVTLQRLEEAARKQSSVNLLITDRGLELQPLSMGRDQGIDRNR